jgi:REP-associated tyrosine transposase
MHGNWKNFLSLPPDDEMSLFRKHERSGRPLGQEAFIERLEEELDRGLRPRKRGPKPKAG